MKRVPQYQVVCLALLLGIAVGPWGCAKKTGMARLDQTTTSMGKVQSDMNQVADQIDTTNSALNEVIRTGQTSTQTADIKKSFDNYSKQVDQMDKLAKTLDGHIDQMQTQGNNYFVEWSKEGATYTNPRLQKLSIQERQRLRNTFNNVTASSVRMRPELNSYVAELQQLKTYLSNDLTPHGIASVQPVARKTESDGRSLKHSIEPVQAQISKAMEEMSPGVAAGAAGGSSGSSPSSGSSSGSSSGGSSSGSSSGGSTSSQSSGISPSSSGSASGSGGSSQSSEVSPESGGTSGDGGSDAGSGASDSSGTSGSSEGQGSSQSDRQQM